MAVVLPHTNKSIINRAIAGIMPDFLPRQGAYHAGPLTEDGKVKSPISGSSVSVDDLSREIRERTFEVCMQHTATAIYLYKDLDKLPNDAPKLMNGVRYPDKSEAASLILYKIEALFNFIKNATEEKTSLVFAYKSKSVVSEELLNLILSNDFNKIEAMYYIFVLRSQIGDISSPEKPQS